MEVVKDRVVLISGATDELGQAVSLRLAKKGARVVVGDTVKSKVDALVDKIENGGGQAFGVAQVIGNRNHVKSVQCFESLL